MFRCLEIGCGCVFDTPTTTIVNIHEYWGSFVNEYAYSCPMCQSTEIEEFDNAEYKEE